MADGLVLRDIHVSPAPPWWPPAPGWWVVAGVLLLLVALVWWWRARVRRRRARIAELFDRSVADAQSPAEQVAAMSELLRRAGRQRDPDADRLEGEAWLAFLDAAPARRGRRAESAPFSQGAGRLLLDGGYRREVDPAEVEALRRLARQRFLQWMGVR
ncbi:DUF4381 family protein [Lysobacter sp.]|uniref:DUF4381 family protein n=1 Tax=Lysobacter sp. TaxID=72226 RepID=UPI002D3858CF|nr:DUF4381 family protein [Lysobacter sp.]HZX78624.1 DUF4381 family protein [Lysobacter sp.]